MLAEQYYFLFASHNWSSIIRSKTAEKRTTRVVQKTEYRKVKDEFPVWQKSNLTLEEAAVYSGIGIHKLRQMTDAKNCSFVLWNGNKRLIKRKKLDEYLENAYSI